MSIKQLAEYKRRLALEKASRVQAKKQKEAKILALRKKLKEAEELRLKQEENRIEEIELEAEDLEE